MKTENKNSTSLHGGAAFALNTLKEPFLLVGLALFWALALPVAAVIFGLRAALDPVFAYLQLGEPAVALGRHRAAA